MNDVSTRFFVFNDSASTRNGLAASRTNFRSPPPPKRLNNFVRFLRIYSTPPYTKKHRFPSLDAKTNTFRVARIQVQPIIPTRHLGSEYDRLCAAHTFSDKDVRGIFVILPIRYALSRSKSVFNTELQPTLNVGHTFTVTKITKSLKIVRTTVCSENIA